MGNKTGITWTDSTWNPVTGCSPISAGCANCYAERYSKRGLGDFKGNPVGRPELDENGDMIKPIIKTRPFSEVRTHPERLDIPLHWRNPRRIFVCSMGDLFHENVPDSFIDQVFAVMFMSSWHTYQILTKRPERMLKYLSNPYMHLSVGEYAEGYKGSINRLSGESVYPWKQLPPDWIWLGVTAENQAMADERIPLLLQTPAAVRFVSVEPMLSEITLKVGWLFKYRSLVSGARYSNKAAAGDCETLPGIDWVIAGTESGPGRRPSQIDDFRSLRDQCVSAGVPFHLKQMDIDGELVKAPLLDGKEWLEFPYCKE